jgi:DNA mismatch repair protein MutL
VHNSYVVTQDEQGVVIIDQHALHERAMFEYLAQRVLAGSLESQRLLMPVVVRASDAACAALLNAGDLLARIGIELGLLAAGTVGVHAFPSFLLERGVEVGEFVEDLLRKAEAGELDAATRGADATVTGAPNANAEHALRDVLDMMACKAAVKAGDHLTPMELAELVKLREDVERSSNCPHGRPTSIRLTIRELERLFGRS